MGMFNEDYFCEDCQQIFNFSKAERHHLFPVNPPCPVCGKQNTRRKWGKFDIKIKGDNPASTKRNAVESAQDNLRKMKSNPNAKFDVGE